MDHTKIPLTPTLDAVVIRLRAVAIRPPRAVLRLVRDLEVQACVVPRADVADQDLVRSVVRLKLRASTRLDAPAAEATEVGVNEGCSTAEAEAGEGGLVLAVVRGVDQRRRRCLRDCMN